MKKYRIVMAAITLLYIVLAVIIIPVMGNIKEQKNKNYNTSINRMMNEVKKGISIENVELILPVTKISYLSADNSDSTELTEFYREPNNSGMKIIPYYSDTSLEGYVRFDYYIKPQGNKYLLVGELGIAALFIGSIFVLIYIYTRILVPFNKLSSMPYELAKGNLNDGIHENKSRFFGKFVWGIQMLKDSLDVHKRQELKLAKEKKVILLTISHDIKTPLNAINLYSKAIEEGLYDNKEELQTAAVHIQDKTKEIDGFIKEIVKSSTEEVVSISVNNTDFYLTNIVNKIKSGYTEKCRINKIMLDVGNYNNHLLTGDIDRLYEAVGNLIENAIKYGDGGTIRISFSEEDYCELISVYNTGKPVEDNDLSHLFDSFFRGSNSEGKQGNGLGLYICSEIMKKMNGDIYVNKHTDGMEFVLVCKQA